MLNLWEILTLAAETHPIPSKRKEIATMVEKLSLNSASGQELSIDADSGAWLLKIHSCFLEGEALIRIPACASEPVTVDKDARWEQWENDYDTNNS